MEQKDRKKVSLKVLLRAQLLEITEYSVYLKLSTWVKDDANVKILRRIAADEMQHYELLKRYTLQELRPSAWRVWKYLAISKLLGITFGLKLMEAGEERAQAAYKQIAKSIPSMRRIMRDENIHEKRLINLIDEERLRYTGSIVLGLNDALVELTGALAGLTFALQDTKRIAFAGFITGIAASLSMAASEYLSTRTDEGPKSALRASAYTGTAYVITVIFLIVPYLIFSNYFVCLAFTLVNALLVILLFNYYISVAKDLPFRRRFFEMAAISLGVAAFTFGLGFLIRSLLGMEA